MLYILSITLVVFITLVAHAQVTDDHEGFNLIDASPQCYNQHSARGDGRRLCPFGAPGARFSVFPNEIEKQAYITRNIARLFPDEYRVSKWGYKNDKFGGPVTYACAATPQEFPIYWNSPANQAARFHKWSFLVGSCDGTSGHQTCLEYCDMFDPSTCGAGARNDGFIGRYTTNGIPRAEGLWPYTNQGMESSGHCGPIFNLGAQPYYYAGYGNIPGTGYATTNIFIARYYLGTYYAPEPTYPISHGTHINEETRVPEALRNSAGKYLAFMVEWYGPFADNRRVQTAYLLYQGAKHTMSLTFGDSLSGFYEINFDKPSECEPYAFVVLDTSGRYWRLPENGRYYYGTYESPDGIDAAKSYCEENHYYYNGNAWKVNSSPEVEASGATPNDGVCVGCSKVNAIRNRWRNLAGPTPSPTPPPTPAPTSASDTLCSNNVAKECITIAGFDLLQVPGGADFNGDWQFTGQCADGLPVYSKPELAGYYLCFVPNNWGITTQICDPNFRVARCKQARHNIAYCNNNQWELTIPAEDVDEDATTVDTSSGISVQTPNTCPVYTGYDVDPECIEIRRTDGSFRGTWTFTGQLVNGKRSYSHSVYTLQYIYDHVYADGGVYVESLFTDGWGWVIVDSTYQETGFLAWCDESLLDDCDGKFLGPYSDYKPQAATTVSSCSAGFSAAEESTSAGMDSMDATVIVMIVVLAVLAVMGGIGVLCGYKKLQARKTKSVVFDAPEEVADESEDADEEEEEAVEVDVEVPVDTAADGLMDPEN